MRKIALILAIIVLAGFGCEKPKGDIIIGANDDFTPVNARADKKVVGDKNVWQFYTAPHNYKDAQGNWKKKNLNFIDETSGEFSDKTADTDYEFRFAKNSKAPQKFGFNGKSVTWRAIGGNNVQGVVSGNKVKYENAWDNTDLIYTASWAEVKEDIILKNSSAPTSFSFKLETGLTIEKTANGVTFGNNELFIDKPSAKDANGKVKDLTFDIRIQGGQTYFDMTLDTTGLAYPITIDPTASFTSGANSWDGCVRRDDTSFAGAHDGAGETLNPDGASWQCAARYFGDSSPASYIFDRTFISWDTSTIADTDTITAAQTDLYESDSDIVQNDSGTGYVAITTSTPADPTVVAITDYQLIGRNELTSSSRLLGSIKLSVYNSFWFSDSNLSVINKTGYTSIGLRIKWDLINSDDTPGFEDEQDKVYFDMKRNTNDPILIVTSTAAAVPSSPPLNNIILFE